MTESLYIRQTIERDQFEWLILEQTTGVVRVRGQGELSALETMITDLMWSRDSGETHYLVLSEDVLLTETIVPSKQPRQILQAVPFLVEEDLAQDIEDCHFAVGPRADNGKVSVAIIDYEHLSRLIEQITSCGASLSTMIPDVLYVPQPDPKSSPESAVRVLVDGSRALVRMGEQAGLAVEVSALPLVLAGQEATSAITIHLHPSCRAGFELVLAQLETLESEVRVEEIDCEPFEFLCRQNTITRTMSLLQGDFRIAEKKSESQPGWRSAAILVACAFGLHVMSLWGQGIYMDVQARQYEQEVVNLYADVFPNDNNVRDIRRRWQGHLGMSTSGSAGDFFALFGETARLLPGDSLRLQNVNFNESRGDLVLQLEARESEQFVMYAQALKEAGLSAEVGTINQDSEVARGSIKVKVSGG